MEGTYSQLVAQSQDNEVTIFWNQQIVTDRTKPYDKPDITLRDRKGTYLLIEVSISSEKDV
jgi:hypothetical protein